MPNPENLRPKAPWKPGQSGNPAGKPRGTKNLSTILRELLERKLDGPVTPFTPKGGKVSVNTMVAIKLIQKALKGDNRSISEVFDRTEGRAIETVRNIEMNPVDPWILEMAPKPVSDCEVMGDSSDEDE